MSSLASRVPFPAHTFFARTGFGKLIHARRTRKAEREMRRLGLDRLLSSRRPDALPQDPADLMFLYWTVMERNVRRGIEFGSGQSTLFIAQALHDQGFGHLWSLDSDAGWLRHTEAMFPAQLRPFVTFVHSPTAIDHAYGVPAYRYTVIPEGEFDFALIDGPELRDAQLSCDLLGLRLSPGAFGMIDHRWRTAVLAKERAGNWLRLRYAPSLDSFTFAT